jgi:hypothetical protein
MAWPGAHCRICRAILDADFPPGPDAQTARYVARSTLEAWEVLPQAGEIFIAINIAYLSDMWLWEKCLAPTDDPPVAGRRDSAYRF